MYKNVIYVVNEVKGVTYDIKRKDGKLGKLVTNLNQNVIRDPNHNDKPFMKVSLTQPADVPAIIICEDHNFETQQVEIAGGQRRFWVKTSTAIIIANNLYNRGIETTIINYNKGVKETIKILPQDYFYDKIDELCGTDSGKAKNRLGKEFKKADKVKSDITLSSFNNLNIKLLDYFNSTEHAKITIDMFRRYATIYGLDTTKPEDLLTFKFCIEHPDCADVFLDGTKFRCPHCGNVVHVNGHEEYIKGKPVNTFETVCDYCGEEFDIHDKQDVLDMLAKRSK